jgi:hypothetical protein
LNKLAQTLQIDLCYLDLEKEKSAINIIPHKKYAACRDLKIKNLACNSLMEEKLSKFIIELQNDTVKSTCTADYLGI